MYRIQAYRLKGGFFSVHTCATMEEREAYIKGLIDNGEAVRAGISWEYLARY